MKCCCLFVTFFVGSALCVLLSHGVAAQSESKSPQAQVSAEENEIGSLVLTPAPGPPEWGKRIAGSSGELKFRPKSNETFVGTIRFKGLEKKKTYKLCFNGKKMSDGNQQLMQYGRSGNEGKYDFQTVQADDAGSVKAKISVRLPASRYDVKFFVKDIAENYSIVLYNDDLRFELGPAHATEPQKTETAAHAQPGDVRIDSPNNNQVVGDTADVEGKVSDPKASVWIIVRPIGDSEFYVQPKVEVGSDGTYSGTVYFGRRDQDFKNYQIRTVVSPMRNLREGQVLSAWPAARLSSKIITVVKGKLE